MSSKIGLALGGGGARGAALIGVLYELEENKIPIDLIVGTSIGSIIGAFYAYGQPLEKMQSMFSNIRLGGLRHFRFLNKGIFSAKSVEKSCEEVLGDIQFGELSIRMAAVATDLKLGKSMILQNGPVKKALSASSAFLPYFAPVEMDGHLLADGGILSNVPVDIARELGSDTVIAIDLGSVPMAQKRPNIISIAGRAVDIMIRKITDNEIGRADVVIRPDIDHFPIFDFSHCDELNQLGRKAAQEAMPAIKKMLALENASIC